MEERFSEVHQVARILKKLIKEKSWSNNKELIQKSRKLEKYWNIPRYPDPYQPDRWNPVEDIAKKEAEEAVENSSFVLSATKELLKKKYQLELESQS